MPSFKLPRLRANLSIVNRDGKPLDYFLRLINIEMAQRIEAAVTDLQDVVDELAAQLLLIQQAQATADAALAAAEEGAGARYTRLDAATLPSATSTVNGIQTGSRLQLSGGLSGFLTGASLDADAEWQGEAELFENNISLGVVAITTQSSGLPDGPNWQAEPSSPIEFDVEGNEFGSVEYRLTITRTGGSNYVVSPNISSVLTITPRAS